MTPAELERLLAERPGPKVLSEPRHWNNREAAAWTDGYTTAHRADAPALVRALEAALAAHWETSARSTQSQDSSAEKARAAFWAALTKEEPL